MIMLRADGRKIHGWWICVCTRDYCYITSWENGVIIERGFLL